MSASPALLMLPEALALAGRITAVGTGLVFSAAALAKLRHRALFPGVVANYRILPDALVMPVARLLPPVELGLGVVLLSGLVAAPAALLAIALLLVFAAAMAHAIGRGRRHIDCGCGHAALRQPVAWPLVLRNIAMAALLLPVFVAPAPPAGSGTWALALAGGLGLALLFQVFNAIVALAGSPLAVARR